MGKKKDKDPSATVQHKEAFMRMNHLYQAAVLMTGMARAAAAPGADAASDPKPAEKAKEAAQDQSMVNLGSYYAHLMRTVGKKLVIRADPSVKRTICKYCDAVLLPGIGADVRTKSKPNKRTSIRCRRCGRARSLVHADPDYVPFSVRAARKPEDAAAQDSETKGVMGI
ncbi:RNAse P Rpr2/Rpp21/SNM1 subunit domain-containing protein [Hyaloraphidium curvatum]|nr:RNAse P Rpr2/Rpp21/SNM1 subunit domain-containing protein [Hyaloraphidium curvatum]